VKRVDVTGLRERLRRIRMQREIKFRGKRVDNGEWEYGYYDGCYETATINYLKNGIPYNVCVTSKTIGQYTGLKDKNGKEIYEGDIVVFEDMTSTESGYWERDCIGIVVWGEETAAFEVTNRLSAESYEVLSDCEVIGNIYENKELLQN
jgi:uncharacterized phage protein (TIGR01671 family)